MKDILKKHVLEANRWIVKENLVKLTWGNVSYYDREKDLIYIKPSGVDLNSIFPEHISVTTGNGHCIGGQRPSVDLPTHMAIYKYFEEINCIVHTHSKYSTIFAQANKKIPCLGTTHADYFYGDIPCIPHPIEEDVLRDYEASTGRMVGEYYFNNKISYSEIPSCLIGGHGAFSWSDTIPSALEIAKVTEIVAEMTYKTLMLNSKASLEEFILSKHFLRKNGENKLYGQ